MAAYAYKTVRDLLPKHIIDKQGPDYNGDANYDGDQWYAAADYIQELKADAERLRSEIAQLRNDVALRDRCIAWCLEHGVYNWDKKVAPLCVHGGNFESDPLEAPAEFAAIIGVAK